MRPEIASQEGIDMKIGFVYAGQGSQSVGMGQDFYEESQLFRTTLDNAAENLKDELGLDIKDLSFNGPLEKLSLTAYTQPAMVAFAVGVTKMLESEGITPEYALGLSLGEYSALFAVGCGVQGLYDSCAYTMNGTGQFRPLEGAQPFLGVEHRLEQVAEERIEML